MAVTKILFFYGAIFLAYFCYPPLKAQLTIGQFHSFAHGVRSGWVTLVDDKTIQIDNFFYDGLGPAAWFVLGRGADHKLERVQLSDFTVIPDESYSCNKLPGYNNAVVTLTLPGSLTVNDFDYLSVYCLEFTHNFGYITIPKTVNLGVAPANNLGICPTPWTATLGGQPQTAPVVSNYLLPFNGNYQPLVTNIYSVSGSSVVSGK